MFSERNMYRLTLLFIISFATATNCMAQYDSLHSGMSNFFVCGGIGIPTGAYGNMDFWNTNSGFAKNGISLFVEYQGSFKYSASGILINAAYTKNPINGEALASSSYSSFGSWSGIVPNGDAHISTNGSYSVATFMCGAYHNFNPNFAVW